MQKVSGEIIIKKDADYNNVCFDIDIEGFFQFTFVYGHRITRPVHLHCKCLPSFLASTAVFIISSFFSVK